MIPQDAHDDAAAGALGALRTHEPGRGRTARIRARSLARLGAPAGRARPLAIGGGWGWRRALEPALVGAAGAAYLADVVRVALRFYGF